jgi:glutathione-independent formaldehyde dehydrogenase
MAQNSGVVYLGHNKVEVQSIDFPTMKNPAGKDIKHGVILKVVSTNICGSDQHMVRGRTTAPTGMVLGHEITGEIIEAGEDVEYLKVGDLVNVACGRCRTCREQQTGVCLNVNPGRAGGAYGYVDMGGWIGGQAEYVLVPYADFNLIKFPDKDQAMSKIKDLTMLSDILPTGFHGAVMAGVGVGSIVYIAGAGPVGMAAAASARILGAALVMVGDMNAERLQHAEKVGFTPVDLTKGDNLGELIAQIGSRRGGRCRRLRSEGAGQRRKGSSSDCAQLLNVDRSCRGWYRHSRTLRDGRSRRCGRSGEIRKSQNAIRSWLGKISPVLYRPDPRIEVQQAVDAGDPS